jgi:1-acyl-sn-glycerol-3-phosphate acyltransferase
MQKCLVGLYVLYFFAVSSVLVAGAALVCLVTAPFDPNRRLLHLYSCWWASIFLNTNPFWKLDIRGLDHIDPCQTYVLVANHQSYADIIVLYQLFRPFKWVSKESIFKVPIIGWNMQLNQYVRIARGNLSSIKEMMQVCRTWLRRGASVLMFPEGTRSPDGELQDFRDGAFRLSIDCRVPLVPVVVNGTHAVLPKGGKTINFRGDMAVRVLPPVNPDDFNNSAAMRDHVHRLMKETLAEMRGTRPTKVLAACR